LHQDFVEDNEYVVQNGIVRRSSDRNGTKSSVRESTAISKENLSNDKELLGDKIIIIIVKIQNR
jgi:hypothetical protein